IDPKRQANIRLAHCWAHARRKLFELTKNSAAQIAQEGLRQITALYRVETHIRSLPASRRLAVRKDESAPMVANFKKWLEQARAQVSAKSPTGEALKYVAKYWDGLILFLTDGRIEMDNNTVERTIRPIAIGRKNSLFAGHEAGARNWAVLASLMETCKLNGIEPHSYLTRALTAIVNGHRQSQISELLPWGYAQTV
ncbi:MAG: IS66 family transposase, partial [Rhodobacterales bacterium]|nr:IS66 family transposase [Rhodobacterales bacterium]